MVKFEDLPVEDKKIICKLLRDRVQNKLPEIEDLDGMSETGLMYYRECLLKSIQNDEDIPK